MQRIDHDVAHETDSFAWNAFSDQVFIRVVRWRKQQVSDLIRQQSIDLFGHRAIATAQSGFDVRHFHSELHTNQRARDRRVHVADDEHPVRLFTKHDRLEALHHCCGLRGV